VAQQLVLVLSPQGSQAASAQVSQAVSATEPSQHAFPGTGMPLQSQMASPHESFEQLCAEWEQAFTANLQALMPDLVQDLEGQPEGVIQALLLTILLETGKKLMARFPAQVQRRAEKLVEQLQPSIQAHTVPAADGGSKPPSWRQSCPTN